MRITFPVKSVDILTVRSLKSVSGVVGVEMEKGRLKDLMESASPEVNNYPISVHAFTSIIHR